MPAKKNSLLVLPEDAYDITLADKERAADELALGMVAPNHPVLCRKADAVDANEIESVHIRRVISKLFEVAEGQRATRKGRRKRTLVGLAAPQIGEAVRIILIDTRVKASRKHFYPPKCFINPEIIWRSLETEEGKEGCFSTGPVWGLVRRATAIKIRAMSPEGKQIECIFEGFTARIVQHEMDHLEGIRFPERIKSDRKRHWVHAEELDYYPTHITQWKRLCTLDRWAKIKSQKG
jgi:peptide deformylase